MKLFDLVEKIEDAPGSWIEFQPGVEFFLRVVPVPEQRRIDNKYLGRERKLVTTNEGRVSKVDADKTTAWFVERACLSLVDSRGAEFSVHGEGLAARFVAAGFSVKAGETVSLDGKWSPAVKEIVLELGPRLVAWVNEQASKLAGLEAEEEAGKEKSS